MYLLIWSVELEDAILRGCCALISNVKVLGGVKVQKLLFK